MARAGVFDDLDCCLSWHPSGEDGVGYSNNTALTTMEFHFTGVEAHAAANPHLGRSALDAVELMNADEAIVTSSSALCMGVESIDGIPVGGRDRERFHLLQSACMEEFQRETKAR